MSSPPRPSFSMELELDESEMAPRRRRTKPTSPRSFLLGILLLFVFLYAGKRAWSIVKHGHAFVKLSNPHVVHHHRPNGTIVDEGKVVRSFFGPGAVESFDLVATIFFSVQEERELDEDGNPLHWEDEEKWQPWERVFSEVVLSGLNAESEGSTVSAKVTLPARILPLLRSGFRPRKSTLLANFHLLPSSLQLPNHLVPLNATNWDDSLYSDFQREARIAEGDTDILPLPWPAVGSTVAAQAHEDRSWVQLLQHHSRPSTLTRRVITQAPKTSEDDMRSSVNWGEVDADLGVVGDDDWEERWPRFVEQRVVSRSMVTLVRDFPVYSLDKFRHNQMALVASMRRCSMGIPGSNGCSRGFANLGHFEYLLEMGSPSSEVVEEALSKRWTYLPFIETSYGGGGPKDFVALPAGDVEEDFTFDWDISFASVTPLKMALAYKYVGPPSPFGGDIIVPTNAKEEYRDILRQENAEFLNALSGHSFDNDARPLLRFSLRRLSSLLEPAVFLVTAPYFWTRTTTVGISVPAQVLESVRALGFVLLSARHGVGSTIHLFFLSAIIANFFVVASLGGRLQWTWGGPGGWVPVGVSRRKATHSERASSRVDERFGWVTRILLFLVFFLLAVLYLPKLPHLISASPPSSPFVGPGSRRNKDGSSIPYLPSANKAFRLLLFLSQFLLNHRSQTFAGTHKLAVALDLVSELAWSLPIVFSSRWGSWLTMEALTAWFPLLLATTVVSGWQAWTLETKKQEDGEEEEEESSR